MRTVIAGSDETYAKIAGRWSYLYRAIDQFGQVIDVLVAEQRDMAAIHNRGRGSAPACLSDSASARAHYATLITGCFWRLTL